MTHSFLHCNFYHNSLIISPLNHLFSREAACKGPLSHEGVEKSPGEVHHLKSPQQLLGKPTTTLSAVSGPHTVLPPIGKTLREGGVEMIPGHSVDTAEAPYRSSSDGYLVQMERQKQKGRGTHKVGVTDVIVCVPKRAVHLCSSENF